MPRSSRGRSSSRSTPMPSGSPPTKCKPNGPSCRPARAWPAAPSGCSKTRASCARRPSTKPRPPARSQSPSTTEHYYDTHGNLGMDGIVYSDRTPQVDYWQVRKVYSPVQIGPAELLFTAGPNPLAIEVENRFDFRAQRLRPAVVARVERAGAAIGHATLGRRGPHQRDPLHFRHRHPGRGSHCL